MTKYIDTAETAKLIRARLKAVFPSTKFSVRIDRYAGGSSIRVTWTDGPTKGRVEREIGAFNNTHFDGMIDMAYGSSSWLTKDGRAIWAGGSGTQGSMGVVPETPIGAPPEEGAELVHFFGSLSMDRTISAGFARKLVQQIGNYWGGVQYWPEILEDRWGFSVKSDTNRTPRDDIGTASWDHHWSWSSMIYRAAEDRQAFMRDDEIEREAEGYLSKPLLTLIKEA